MTPALGPVASTFSLSRFVEDVRVTVSLAGSVRDVARLPDGRTALVLRVLEEGQKGDLSVLGPRTRPLYKRSTGVTRVVVIQLKPGWSASLLGVAASELTDRIVPLHEIWDRSGSDLCSELLAVRSLPQMLDRISRAIAARTRDTFQPASARLARRAAALLETDEVRVDSVAKRLGVTARHLRRVFSENVGVGPKDFVRSVRLQRAVRMATRAQASKGSMDWVRIATEAGYYDQAHLIADFRELVGCTPGAFARRSSGSVRFSTGG